MLRRLIRGGIPVLVQNACNSSSLLAYIRVFHAPAAVTPDSNSNLAVSYLIESVGLSPSAALVASKDVRLKTTAKADSVLLFLNTYGFTRAQIVDILTRLPVLLSADTERLKRKLEFLLGAGMPKDHLLRFITLDPCILKTSLEKRLIPNITLLKTILGNITQVSSAIAGSTRLVRLNLENHVLPNIRTLQNHGVPQHRIVKLATLYPRSLLQNPVKFSRSVCLVKDMGLDPWKVNYILAVNVLSGATQSTWEKKMQLYRSFGWSEEETISAFKKHPFCMLLSAEEFPRVKFLI
ncbi:hypothetical protein HPP92_001705 [Vanilla planifolia]|uniref:Uncharacterized protein n=1 Tax=Vanilla planifolia TaxID=51239 RepID=A0A835RS52_VANPL|nr:hypothetical protein HPP92_001705 [Vanilla planifolia]